MVTQVNYGLVENLPARGQLRAVFSDKEKQVSCCFEMEMAKGCTCTNGGGMHAMLVA